MKTLAVLTVCILISTVAMASPLMYVPTGNANDIVIIDLETDAIIGRIDELENAHGLAASPNSEYLVAGSMQPAETGDSGASVNKPAAVSEAAHAAHHPGGADATMNAPGYLAIVHPRRGHVMRRIAMPGLTHHIAISPDGRHAVAVHSGAGGISIVDLTKMEIVKTIRTGPLPNFAVFSRDGRRLYVSNAGAGSVSEVNADAWVVTREIKVGTQPEHMVLSAAGATLFVVDVSAGLVAAVDLENGVVRRRLEVGEAPHGIDVSADGRWLFVSSQGDHKLIRFDLTDQSSSTIDLQPAPYHVAYIDEVGKLYVSSRKVPKIWVLDPRSLQVGAEIDIGRGVAHQMAVLPQ